MNGNKQQFGRNKDLDSFFIDADDPICEEEIPTGWYTQMSTPFVIIQDGKVTSTFCDDDDEKEPHMEFFQDMQEVERLLLLGYSRHKNSKNIIYNNYGKKNYNDARDKCADDRTSLPVPRSGLIKNRPLWLQSEMNLKSLVLSKIRC